ncbi:MAG: DUF3047 domain-containing protein [Pseudomonadales bacterium]|nr:DUF3047 domain-containing protein [Pseudomonadales bacterium]
MYFIVCLLGLPALVLAADPLLLGDFSRGFDDWTARAFVGNTRYQLVRLDGEQVLQAQANGTASGLYRELRIDLKQTPWLHWRWRIDSTLGADIDEHSKAGDDYPARLYVIKSGGLAFWRTRTINYVWSSNNPVDQRWNNAYAGRNSQMWPVDSGDANVGIWVSHSRDIRADWLQAFGEDIGNLDAVALMTDTDNSGGSLTAWYADIRFQASADPLSK